MSSEIKSQSVLTPWEQNVWKEWQDYQKLSQSRKCGVAIGGGIGIGLSAFTAFLLSYPETIFAVPIIMAAEEIMISAIEKGTDRFGKGLGMIPMTGN